MNHFGVGVPSFRAILKFKECFHWTNMENGVSGITIWVEKAIQGNGFYTGVRREVDWAPQMPQRAFSRLFTIPRMVWQTGIRNENETKQKQTK